MSQKAVTITRRQCAAARALLGWEQTDLAERSKVSRSTIQSFERGLRTPRGQSMEAMCQAFSSAGIRFVDTPGPGVILVPDPAPSLSVAQAGFP